MQYLNEGWNESAERWTSHLEIVESDKDASKEASGLTYKDLMGDNETAGVKATVLAHYVLNELEEKRGSEIKHDKKIIPEEDIKKIWDLDEPDTLN